MRSLQDVEVEDSRSLYTAFERHLRHHNKDIEINNARAVAERYGVIREVLQKFRAGGGGVAGANTCAGGWRSE
jgi:hypothetical protein